jgi:lipopolysaccharide/colanic/teichoic acid biosynthesis glycosyltransferase
MAPRRGSWADFLFNRGLALICLVPAIPVLAILWCVYFVTDRKNGPFLYRGERMGKYKHIFTIYKVRTLLCSAEATLGGRLCRSSDDLHTPYGDFLRRTRLDEIPQLFNILKGEMDFVGPRPERPAIYEAHASRIADYEERFGVRPGLTGISQFFTPHGTPKRMRARLDNRYLRAEGGLTRDLGLLGLTAGKILWNLFREAGLGLRHAFLRPQTVRPDSAFWKPSARFGNGGGTASETRITLQGQFIDLSDEEVLLEMNPEAVAHVEFHVMRPHPRRSGRVLRVRCQGTDTRHARDPRSGKSFVALRYQPVGDLNAYKLEKYILGKSIA